MLPGVFGTVKTFIPAAARFREQWEFHGHIGTPRIGNVFHTHVARTSQEAHARWAPHYRAYLDFVDAIWDGGGLFDGNGRAGLPEAVLFESHRSHRQRGHPAARAGTGRCRGPMMEAPNTAETACNTHTTHTYTINTDTKRTG